MPEHDTGALILGRGVEDICECRIHARRQRVTLCWTIQFDAKDASYMFRNDVGHRVTPCGPSGLGRLSAPLHSPRLSNTFLCSRYGAASVKLFDLRRPETELGENFAIV